MAYGLGVSLPVLCSKGVHRPPKTKPKPLETEVGFGQSWLSRTDGWAVWPVVKLKSFRSVVCLFSTQPRKMEKLRIQLV